MGPPRAGRGGKGRASWVFPKTEGGQGIWNEEGPCGSKLLPLELGNRLGWGGVGVGTETSVGGCSAGELKIVTETKASFKRESSRHGRSWWSLG